MDPLSAVSSAFALVATCSKVSQGLNDICSSYSRANVTISAISTECTIISSTLSQVGQLIQRDPTKFANKSNADVGPGVVPLDVALRNAIDSGDMAMTVLQGTIKKFQTKGSPGVFIWKSKVKFMWNEGDMQSSLDNVRRLQQAIGTLLAAIQADSMSDVKSILQANSAALHSMQQRSKSGRQRYPASTISGISTTFDFDDDVVSSTAYRRAFKSFTNIRRKPLPDLPKPSIDVYPAQSPVSTELTQPSTIPDGSTTPAIDSAATDERSQPLNPTLATTQTITAPDMRLRSTPELEDLLRSAIGTGEERLVQTLLDKGADIECIDETSGMSPLHFAVSKQKPAITELLLARGALQTTRSHAGNFALHYAAISGDTRSVALLVNKGADVNGVGEKGRRPLHCAVANANLAAIRQLLSLGADIELANEGEPGHRPLHLAVKHGNDAITRAIIEEGKADVETAEMDGMRALHLAAKRGFVSIMRILLDAGADINSPGCNSCRPLHYAVYEKKLNVVALLMERGASTNPTADDGDTALHIAARNDEADIVELLLNFGAEVDVSNLGSNHPLQSAAIAGKTINMAALLRYGASIDSVGVDQKTALMISAQQGHLEAVKLLLDQGANTEAADIRYNRSLHLAALNNRVDIIRLLLDSGADIEARGSTLWSPLHFATDLGSYETAELLIARGADIHARSENKNQPIHWAAKSENTSLLKLLLNAGASIESEGDEGYRPINMAAKTKTSQTLKYLIDQGVEVNVRSRPGAVGYLPIHDAAHYGCVENVKLLLEAGADRNATTDIGDTPIMVACAGGNLPTLQYLLESDAQINEARVPDKCTPLHVAAGRGKLEVVDFLLSKKADVELKTDAGSTALHLAAGWAPEQSRHECVRKLIDAGVNVNTKNNKGWTSLHYAVQEGDLRTVRLLLEGGADRAVVTGDRGLTPAALAVTKGYAKILELLLP